MKEFFGNMLSRLASRKLGMFILGLQLITSVGLVVLVERLHILKPLYISAGAAVLFVLFVLMVMAVSAKSGAHVAGQVLSFVFAAIFAFAGMYVFKTRDALGSMTGNRLESQKICIYVLKTNAAETINDLAEGTFGYFDDDVNSKVKATLDEIEGNLNTTIEKKAYLDAATTVQALYDGKIDAIVMDESYVSVVEERKEYKEFSEKTKVLETYEHKSEIKQTAVSDVTKTPFTVFLSGIDTYGDVNKKSRSDVNMTATVNPTTKTILLLSTPRDYYVETTVSKGMRDKLTHAGLYGIECSMGTLQKLYDTDINYYVRVNFSGFQDVVDALGGLRVYSDYTFTTRHSKVSFKEGYNDVNGEQALAFARERYAFAAGDIQRNKDQRHVVEAFIKKVSSPAVLTRFDKILASVQKNFTTNLEYNDLAALVQMQLDDPTEWTVITVGVEGEGKKRTTYSDQHHYAYVMFPDEVQVANASKLIDEVIAGKKLTQEEAENILKMRTVYDGTTPVSASATPSATKSASN